MRVKLYPNSKLDRALFWLAVMTAVSALGLLLFDRSFWGKILAAVAALSSLYNFVMVYGFQDTPDSLDGREYTEMLAHIDETRSMLQRVSEFLESEQRRVNESERTLERLQNEKSMLEPVVMTQRATVDAILNAYTTSSRASIWKDRLLGFGVGILSSVVATLMLYLLGWRH
jgi:hypothetical protein